MSPRTLTLLTLAVACLAWGLHKLGVVAWVRSQRLPPWLAKYGDKLLPFALAAFCLVAAFGLPSVPSIPWPEINWPVVVPPAPPTPVGATHFIVLHEATKDDARFGELAQELQDSSSPAATAIAAAGWKVQVLDDNATTGSDQPHPTLAALGVFDTIADGRRELVAFNPPATLVAKEPIPADATADSVLAMIQARGRTK